MYTENGCGNALFPLREKRTSAPRRVTPEIVKRAVGPSVLRSPHISLSPPFRPSFATLSHRSCTLVFSLPRRFRLSSDARCTRSLALFTINYEAVDSQTPS